MIDIFKALSDETRLRILAQIINAERSVCEIEQNLKLTQPNASKHLTILKKCKILISKKKAQWTFYEINPDFIKNQLYLYSFLKEELVKMPFYQKDCEHFVSSLQKNKC